MFNSFFLQTDVAGPLDWTAAFVPIVAGLVVLTAVIALIMSLMSMAKNPGAAKKSLFGILGLAGLLLITYLVSNNKQPEGLEHMVSEGGMQLVNGALLATAIILVLGILLLIFDVLKGMFKF